MTQIFNEDGVLTPVTVLQAGPCVVTQVKTVENDGYNAVQVGFVDTREKLVNKPQKGHFDKAGVAYKKFVRELKLENAAEYALAQEIKADIFAAGDKIDATAVSKGKGFQPNCFMTDKQLAQATFAMRIFDHDVDISYSTREPAYIRDNMATLGVTTMSAESKVNPGGYHTYPQALEQFTVSDERTAKVINARLKELGREPVWKDWDASFDFFGNIANG